MSKRDMTELVRKMRSMGIEVELSNGVHWRAMTPMGPVFMPSTPSDHRGIKNAKSMLRRKGVEV